MNENAHGDGECEIDDDGDNGGDCDVVDDIYIIYNGRAHLVPSRVSQVGGEACVTAFERQSYRGSPARA